MDSQSIFSFQDLQVKHLDNKCGYATLCLVIEPFHVQLFDKKYSSFYFAIKTISLLDFDQIFASITSSFSCNHIHDEFAEETLETQNELVLRKIKPDQTQTVSYQSSGINFITLSSSCIIRHVPQVCVTLLLCSARLCKDWEHMELWL